MITKSNKSFNIVRLSAHNLPAALAFIYSSINSFKLEQLSHLVSTKMLKSESAQFCFHIQT